MTKVRFGTESRGRRPTCVLALLTLLACGVTTARAQEPPAKPPAQAIPFEELRRAPGKLLSKGRNASPVGELKVKTYRLEEVPLPEPLEFNDRGARTRVETAIRLIATFDTPLVGPSVIWIGDEGFAASPTQKNEVAALLIGTNVSFEHGAAVSVSSGTNLCDSGPRSTLPDRLNVPSHLRRGAASAAEPPHNFVKSIRTIPDSLAVRGAADVELVLATDVQWTPRNEVMVLQIGAREFVRDPDNRGTALAFRLTAEEFARAKEGAAVNVKYGACSLGGVRFGYLSKDMLNR